MSDKRRGRLVPAGATVDAGIVGSCCVCEQVGDVNNVMMLHVKGPSPGKGWGCVVCRLPTDGAIAVVCDDCLPKVRADPSIIRFACLGYVGDGGRVPLAGLTDEHEHDLKIHGFPRAEEGPPL